MKKSRIFKPALLGTTAALLCLGTTAYAADLGGIRTTMQAWISGEQQNIEITELEPGHYTYDVEVDGETITRGGGGVKFDENGNEIPITMDEFIEDLAFGLDEDENGAPYFYDHQYKVYLTDDIQDADGNYYLLTHVNGQDMYYTITLGEGSSNYTLHTKPDFGKHYFEVPEKE